ncbi:MAG: hybrid sensor histidine kinase/response regulator, partial [Bdellovibrionota bacterium]|nr:hybrid sensor histidine kinase/response regulator [Bdellovibrionota bacterium]
NQLLNFQKAVVNKDKIKLNPINLIKFCENVSKTFGPTCESSKLKFNFLIGEENFDRITIEDYRFYIEINLDSLEKILFNLLANAFKYSPRNGTITLSITKHDHNLRIGVKDEGPGIPKKDQTKIFQSFVQVDSNNGKEGTGLGLSLVKELAESMKGSVGVESDGKNGSYFWVDFPSFNPRNIIDFVLIIPKKEDTSDYRKLFLKDFTWEKIHTLKDLKNFSNLFYPKIILIDPRLEDSQENLELWENITDSIPDSYFLSLEKEDKIDNELKLIMKKKVAESLIKDRPILFDYELRDLLIVSLKDIYLSEYEGYLNQTQKGKAKRKIDFVQTITEAKKRLKGNKYKCIMIDLTHFEYEGIHLLKFSHLISSLTKKVAVINPDVLKRRKKDIMDVPYIDRYFISFEFNPIIKVIEDYIQSSKIISTESYALKNWIFEYKGKSDDSGEEETEESFELTKEDLKTDIGSGLNILIIDDIKDMRTLLKNILLPHGYKVSLAKNPEEGLKKVVKIKPDLVIVDWMMGETSGIDFIKSIRSDQKSKTTPIILLTAKSDEESRTTGVKSGADAFLGKPFNEVELVSLVRNLTRLKENEKKLSERSHHLLVSKMEMEYLMDEIYHQQKNQKEILNTIPEALLLFDEDGVISDVGSKISEDIFGKLIFKSDLLSPDEKHYVWDILELE